MIRRVSLKAVIDEMDVPSEAYHAYLNKQTGELFAIGDAEIDIIERGDSIEDCPEWQLEAIRRTQEILGSPDYIKLPSKFDIHEYSILERFSFSRDDPEVRERLFHCIHGSGAFRRFRETIHEFGIVDDWYKFRRAELREIAVSWLEANGIPYAADEK